MKTPVATEVDIGAGHIVLDGFPALRERGTAPPPLLGPCLLWPRSPISATAELLLDVDNSFRGAVHSVHVLISFGGFRECRTFAMRISAPLGYPGKMPTIPEQLPATSNPNAVDNISAG